MSPLRTDVSGLRTGANPDDVLYSTNNKFMTADLFTPAFNFTAGMLINDVAIDPDNGDAFFSDSLNCREAAANDNDIDIIIPMMKRAMMILLMTVVVMAMR
jgi:hypothetical protein